MSDMPLAFVATFVAIFVLARIYARGYDEGTRFGLLGGAFVTCTHVADNYLTLNIGRAPSPKLAAASLVQWTLVSIGIGLIYRPGVTAAP